VQSRSEYLNELKLFDDFFKNETFVFENANWWPLIRIQIAYRLHLQLTKKKDSLKTEIVKKHISVPKLTLSEKLSITLFKNTLRQSGNTLAVFTETAHATTKDIQGNFINQYTQPFLSYFNDCKIEYDVFDLSAKDNDITNYVALKKHQFVKVAKKFNEAILFQEKLLKIELFFFQKNRFDFSLYNLLSTTIVNNQAIYLTYTQVFKSNNLKNILYYCYYNNAVMAINRAAKDLGIKTVEYQHSLITNQHFAYSGWDERIKNSESFFPSQVWVWDNIYKMTLENNFKWLKNHQVIEGGNVYLSLIDKTQKPINDNSLIKVLVTLQGIGLPDFIKKFIANNKHIFWYFRFHPRYPQDIKEISELVTLNTDNTDVVLANELSLHQLFSQVNYHVTCFSGSALEAEAFNVQNIIYGADGLLAYEEYIEEKRFLYITSEDDLKNLFLNPMLNKGDESHVALQKQNITQKINSIFATS
jgi:hypothetical protein